MTILSIVLVSLYALLNAVLAVAGLGIHPEASIVVKLLPCTLFALAALCLAWGAATRGTGVVITGLVLGSVAPIAYGALVEHSNVPLHHGVRAAVAVVIALVWWAAWHRI